MRSALPLVLLLCAGCGHHEEPPPPAPPTKTSEPALPGTFGLGDRVRSDAMKASDDARARKRQVDELFEDK